MKNKESKHLNTPLPENIILKDYTITKKISSGAFSFVYMGVNNITKEVVAIKEYMPNSMRLRNKGVDVFLKNLKEEALFTKGLSNFFNEMALISHIKHNNIINITDYFEMNGTAYIVMPYENGMPLSSYLSEQAKKNQVFTEHTILTIFIALLEALKVLHENNILHLDLKPNNIWFRKNKEILLLDFGISIEKNTLREHHFRTKGYGAIEQYESYYDVLNLGAWTDYYGIGATMYSMLTFNIPEESVKLHKQNKQLNVYEDCATMYHYKILEAVNILCQTDFKMRQKINIDKLILELKNIVPFFYEKEMLEETIIKD